MPSDSPLEPPRDAAVWERFRTRFGLARNDTSLSALVAVSAAFASVPYENLTKIVRWAACGNPLAARRGPGQVLDDFHRYGAGGTCFALTAALLHLLRAAGWEADPILADRRYGANTHCALLARLEGTAYLLDPGYLILQPVPLRDDGRSQRIFTSFNHLEFAPSGGCQSGGSLSGGNRWDLFTHEAACRRLRLTYKTAAAAEHEFLAAWDASFSWEMMQYPVLTRVDEAGQTYLRGTHLQRRTQQGVHHAEIPLEKLAATIVGEFGLAAEVVDQALRVLRSTARENADA